MTADTLYSLSAPLTLTPSQLGKLGRFKLTNRSTAALTVELFTDRGAATIDVTRPGDATSFDLHGVRFVRVSASAYPASILLESTELAIDLDAAPIIGNTAADPVFVTGLGVARFAGTDDQSGTAPGAANTGAATLYSRTIRASDPRAWFAVPANSAVWGEAMLILVEFPAVSPVRIDAAGLITNQPSTPGGTATGPIPNVITTGAALDLVAYYDDPDYHPLVPVGFTEAVYFPRPGAARLSGLVGYKLGAGGAGLAFAGGGTGAETQWKTARATFSGVTGAPLQVATGFSVPADTAVEAIFAGAMTPGSLLVGWLIAGQAGSGAPLSADLLPLAP